MEFQAFSKIPRLNRDIVITEKIDGTNAQVHIIPKIEPEWAARVELPFVAENADFWMLAGSRSRWVTPGKGDNFGFAAWVKDNATELFRLGSGRHFGEWWGPGIQRGYGLAQRRFSLFNTAKWGDPVSPADMCHRPACCDVVPVLYTGPILMPTGAGGYRPAWEVALDSLRTLGSAASPGFMRPEGIVIFHTAASALFKVTLEGDEKPKGVSQSA